jgi:hypothetical protein
MAPADYFLLKKVKMGAGMPEPGPGQHQERLGGGRQITDRRRLCRRLQKLRRALQKVRPPRRQVRQKMLRNKHPPSSNHCHFIYTFAFVCIHTLYMYVAARIAHCPNTYPRKINVVFIECYQIGSGRGGIGSPINWMKTTLCLSYCDFFIFFSLDI